jgi:hypothetical protein
MRRKTAILGCIMAISVAMSARADIGIAVSWESGLLLNSSSLTVMGESYHQLLWSPTDPSGFVANYTTANYLDPTSPEVLLFDGFSEAGDFGKLSYTTSELYFDAHVDPLGTLGYDINTGYLYSRVFEVGEGDLGAGVYYYQGIDPLSPSLTEWDTDVNPPDLEKIIFHETFDPSGFAQVDTEMVPEPGALSLLALGIVTLAFRHRRKKQ